MTNILVLSAGEWYWYKNATILLYILLYQIIVNVYCTWAKLLSGFGDSSPPPPVFLRLQ